MAENGKSHEIAHPKKGAFLAAFEECGSITKSAVAAGIYRRTHYDWLENDEDYGERFKEAKEVACEALELEARRRAVEGWDEPVFFKDEVVGHKRRFDSTLLIFLLKANNPEKFADRHQHEHSGTVDHRVGVMLDKDWYGTADRLTADALAASNGHSVERRAIQADSGGSPNGQNGNGADGGSAGPRLDAGDVQGGD